MSIKGIKAWHQPFGRFLQSTLHILRLILAAIDIFCSVHAALQPPGFLLWYCMITLPRGAQVEKNNHSSPFWILYQSLCLDFKQKPDVTQGTRSHLCYFCTVDSDVSSAFNVCWEVPSPWAVPSCKTQIAGKKRSTETARERKIHPAQTGRTERGYLTAASECAPLSNS